MAPPADLNQRVQMRRTIERLTEEFAGVFGPQTIESFANESLAKLMETAKVQAHLPVLTERFARSRLKALAQADGLAPKELPEVLYVCVHNAGRSQMAALLTTHLSGGRVNVRSAGSDPADSVNPLVVEAMTELGLDMSAEFPKPLTDEVVRAADAVVTMGCGDSCPLYPGKRYEDWELTDPADATSLDQVREIREEIAERVTGLLGRLGITVDATLTGAAG